MILEGIMPIPMPISGGGGLPTNAGVAALIVADFFIVVTYLIRAMLYKKSYRETFWSFMFSFENLNASMINVAAIIVNGMALFIWLVFKISNWL